MERLLKLKFVAVFCVSLVAGACPGFAQTANDTGIPLVVAPSSSQQNNGGVTGQLKYFGDINYWEQKDSRPGHGRKDNVIQPQASFEYRVTQSFALTFGGNYTHLEGAKFDPAGTYRLDGVTGYVGTTFYFSDNYNLNITGGALTSRIFETRPSGVGFASADKTNNGGFVSATLNGSFSFDKFRAAPFVNLLYYSGVESAGFESDGFYRPANPDHLGRLTVGSELYYRASLGNFTIEPMIRAAFLYDYKLLNDWHDRTAFELATGFNVPIKDRLTAAFRVITTVGRDDYQSIGARGSVYYQF